MTKPHAVTLNPAARRLLIGVAVALGLVILAPILLSGQDLYQWAHSTRGLDLARPFAVLAPVALDVAAAACIGMVVIGAVWRRERPGTFGVLVWVFALTSAYAQYRHGTAEQHAGRAQDAWWAFPALALLGPTLLECTLHRVRRWARQDAAELLSGAAGFGARWLPGVAFRETLAAWAASRREGIATAAAAIAYVREREALRGMAPVDALHYAFSALGHFEPYAARVWLQARGVVVDQAAIDVATAGRPAPVRPALAPVSPAAPSVPVSPAAAPAALVDPEQYHREQLAACGTNRDRIRYAFSVLGSYDAPAARRWLSDRGVSVSRSDAHELARKGTGDTPSGAYLNVMTLAPAGGTARINGHATALAAVNES